MQSDTPNCGVHFARTVQYGVFVGPKTSTAGFELRSAAASTFLAGLKRSTPASQPAVVSAPPEVKAYA